MGRQFQFEPAVFDGEDFSRVKNIAKIGELFFLAFS